MNDKLWYHEGLRFCCTGCGACCAGAPGHVWINKAEIQAMATTLGLDVDRFEAQYVRRVGIRKSLTELGNGDCVFLDGQSRRCRVYGVRPRQCRTWPFWASNLRSAEAWERMARHCPGADHGPLAQLRKIRALEDMIHV
ncbi:MAG: hypothetical protein A2V70_06000 [Planctomycetes bacterium RBG_13_63_9]|nr:MAG: hypothetical protein A2V70_06000 [Planctomycetes bacterium RBG_13_63_9]